MRDLAGKGVLVLGLGISGRSAARFCADQGARVVAVDEGTPHDWATADRDARVEYRVGADFPDPAGFDLVVPSPGVPPARYADRAPRAWGDVELAYRALPVPVVAVTGTNGKSTTTLLIEAMLRAAGLRARAAGNVGHPVLELVGEALDVAVIEVSSFQLETTEAFRPRVAVLLNVSPDHLDRHGSFEAYVEAKARILANQQADDVAVLGFDDPVVRSLASRARGRVVPISSTGPLDHGVWLDAGAVALRAPGEPLRRVPLDGLPLAAVPQRENAVAALAAAWALGVEPLKAASALHGFRGLRHRAESVGCVGGVTYVDDSKATNPGAAQRALETRDEPVVWIAGGADKGLAFDELARTAAGRVRAAILIGETAERIERALAGRVEVYAEESLEDAVRRAAGIAEPGDVVLLSPACASWDQFRSFEERGDRFRAAVESLPRGGTG